MIEKLSWFAARLLFESTYSGGRPEETLFEEKVVLIKSDHGIEDAEKRARKIGLSSTESYQNMQGQTVTWAFREVLDLVQLNEADIGEGSEVYYHFLKPDEVTLLRESLKPSSI